MDYLGLGPDEAYDDYDQSVAQQRPAPRRRQAPVYEDDVYYEDDEEAMYEEEPAPRARPRQRVADDSGVTVRPLGSEYLAVVSFTVPAPSGSGKMRCTLPLP